MTRSLYLYFAWLVALIATLISLYLSVIRHLPVCDLCWYQRICIYPLVIILGIASFREDAGIVRYTLPLVIIGFLFSLYQYLEQLSPGFSGVNVCGLGPDCSHVHVKLLGFITLPFLGMLTTAMMAIFLILARGSRPEH